MVECVVLLGEARGTGGSGFAREAPDVRYVSFLVCAAFFAFSQGGVCSAVVGFGFRGFKNA